MSEHDVKSIWLDKVCSAVGWKAAHDVIRRDLSDHIEDQAEAFSHEGMDPDEAMKKAVLEMGDAEEVGFALDASYRPRDVMGISIPVAGLVLIGMVCRIWVTSTPVDAKYIAAIIIGSVLAFVLYHVNLYKFAKHSRLLFWACLAAIIITGLTFFRTSYHLRFNNPVIYYAACFSPVLYAGFVYSTRGSGIKGLLFCGLAAALMCLSLLLIPSLTGIFISAVSYLIILVATILSGLFGERKFLLLGITAGGLAIGALIALALMPAYFHNRLTFMLHPELQPNGAGYIGTIIREAVSRAKFIGSPGNTALSPALAIAFSDNVLLAFKWDLLITIILYRYGWLPVICIIMYLSYFIVTGFKSVLKLSSILGRLLGCGIMSAFAMQIIIYILYDLGILLLLSPLPLPFIAHGNIALMANLAMAGILFSLLRMDGLHTDTALADKKRLRIRISWE